MCLLNRAKITADYNQKAFDTKILTCVDIRFKEIT